MEIELGIENIDLWVRVGRSVVAEVYGKDVYFPKTVKGLEKCIKFLVAVFGNEILQEEVDVVHLKVYGRSEYGGYTVTLDCDKGDDHLGLNFSPDWSSRSIYSRLPKTVDGLIRALPDLK